MRLCAIVVFLFFGLSNSYSLTNEKIEYFDNPATILILNSLFPGYAQFKSLEYDKMALYVAYYPLYAISLGLTAYYFYDLVSHQEPGKNYLFVEDNRLHYFYKNDSVYNSKAKWALFTGSVAGVYAALLMQHSQYDAENHYLNKHKELSLSDILMAPYRKEFLFNFDFFPFFPMMSLLQTSPTDYYKMGDFFNRESVRFMGQEISPYLAAPLSVLSAWLLVTANSAWEEIAYRGILLKQTGLHRSSIDFGTAHIFNAIMPNVSIEESAMQSAFATLFGYYAAHITLKNQNDIRRAVALHFWHNVTSIVLGYLVNPDDFVIFSTRWDFEF